MACVVPPGAQVLSAILPPAFRPGLSCSAPVALVSRSASNFQKLNHISASEFLRFSITQLPNFPLTKFSRLPNLFDDLSHFPDQSFCGEGFLQEGHFVA